MGPTPGYLPLEAPFFASSRCFLPLCVHRYLPLPLVCLSLAEEGDSP
jgi:hypothetical protein